MIGDRIYNSALKEANGKNYNVKSVLLKLNKAIDLGNPKASYALGSWYLHGKNVSKDYSKAIDLLKLSAAKNNSDACYDLAVCFEKGAGVKKDKVQAFKYYLKAALYGDVQSNYEVGRCYYYGIGIAKDKHLADIWLEKAETLGITG